MSKLCLWSVVEAVQDASDADAEVMPTLVDLLLTNGTASTLLLDSDRHRTGGGGEKALANPGVAPEVIEAWVTAAVTTSAVSGDARRRSTAA